MKAEAKTSFKAAALYFVVMVFSIIYSQNVVRVHLIFGLGFKIWWRRMRYFIFSHGWKNFIVVLYNKYKRREYRDIPEKNVTRANNNNSFGFSGGGDVQKMSSNSLKRDKGDLTRNPSSFDSTIGLSMRERDGIGAHFEQQEGRSLNVVLSADLDDLELYKPKKK
jgi:hypothetical protein